MPQQQPSNSGLKPRLGLFTTIMIVMGSLIGSGIFKKIAPMSSALHSGPMVLVCWLVAGIITLFSALTFAEISGRLAQTGGLYAYLRVMYGDWAGFIFGWSCFFVIQSASMASITYVFAEACVGVLHLAPTDFNVKLFGVATLMLLTLFNFLGVVFGAWIENVFTVLKTLGIFVVIYLGFTYGTGTHENFSWVYDTHSAGFRVDSIPFLFAAMLGAFWAFDGINNIGFLGGEVKNAKRNIPLALVIGVLAVLAVYMITNISFLQALPLSEIMAQKTSSVFAVDMVGKLRGPDWGLFVAVLILVSTFGSANSSILGSSRIYFAMANDGLFFKPFAKLHQRFHTPSTSLWMQAIWASVLLVSGSFDQLTDMLIFASFVFYGLGAWGLFILRKKNIGSPAYKVPAWIAAFYVVFCCALVVVNIYQNPREAGVGLLLILTGIPVYMWLLRERKKVDDSSRPKA